MSNTIVSARRPRRLAAVITTISLTGLGLLVGQAPASAAVNPNRHALIIGIDGATYSVMQGLNLPAIEGLQAGGGTATGNINASTSTPTLSGPGWSTNLTGVQSAKHKVVNNSFSPNAFGSFPNVLARIEAQDPAADTAAAVGWAPLTQSLFTGPGTVETNGSDASTTSTAVSRIRSGVDAMFVHLENVDTAGHSSGSSSQKYKDALVAADRQVGQMVAAVRARPSNEQWLIIVTADHGHLAGGGHGGQSAIERTTFVVSNGAGGAAGIGPRIAPTVLKWLGLTVPAGLDGTPWV